MAIELFESLGSVKAGDGAGIEGVGRWSGIWEFDGSRGNYRSAILTYFPVCNLQVRCIDDFHIVSVSLFVYIILLLLIQYSCVKSVKRIRKGKHDFPKKRSVSTHTTLFQPNLPLEPPPLFLVLSMHGGTTELNITRLVR